MEPADLGLTIPRIGVEPYTHAGETGSESMWRTQTQWQVGPGPAVKAKTKVTVYSDGETAELIVNGHSYGRKKDEGIQGCL